MKHLPAAMLDMLWIVLVLAPTALVCSHLAAAAAASGMVPSPTVSPPHPGSKGDTSMCGNVRIPYPFSINQDSALPMAMGWGNFTITCNYAFDPPKPFIHNVEVISISLEDGQIVVQSLLAYKCYNSSTKFNYWYVYFNFLQPYLISSTSNEFVAIGCDTEALLANNDIPLKYNTGCISYCASVDDAAKDGDDCMGLGCCKAGIVDKLDNVTVYWPDRTTGRNSTYNYSPCSYAFMAKKGWYKFSRQDLHGHGNNSFLNRFSNETVPLVLDWAIRNSGSCVNESGALKGPACVSNNSICVNATNGDGYLCNCTTGYTGNPYIHGGCTNINECQFPESHNCPSGSKCIDTDGGYKCQCKFGRRGKQCGPLIPTSAVALLATFVAVILGCVAIVLLQTLNNKKRFNRNGGKILATHNITIYSKRQLKNITNGYRKRLGGGHFGNVYEGTIDGQKVAVKCSKGRRVVHRWKKLMRPHVQQQGHDEDGSPFINEIKFQFDARHKNMVQLLGCCLETEIPMLVFEFISNGSLDDALHSAEKPCTLSLLQRLHIAIGSAEAIAYMHSLDNQKHVHGDIKPSNILLDDGLNPKVSDFGSSKLLSVDSNYVRAVAGDKGYMDPLYVDTDHFTLECDVYSFGVVLLELITRKRAWYEDDGNKLLRMEFVRCFKDEGSGRTMYDETIYSSGQDAESQRNTQCLDRIAMLAVRCLNTEDNRERPTMAEVVEELKQVKVMACPEASG